MAPRSLATRILHRTRTFGRLSRHQWWSLGRSLVWVPVTRVALKVCPWQVVSRAFDRQGVREQQPDLRRAKAAVWAVEAVSTRVLRDRPCLTQALVARRFLRQCGVDALLKIGVARDEGGEFQAHAWLEYEGRIVIGGANSGATYTTFRAVRPVPPPGQGV